MLHFRGIRSDPVDTSPRPFFFWMIPVELPRSGDFENIKSVLDGSILFAEIVNSCWTVVYVHRRSMNIVVLLCFSLGNRRNSLYRRSKSMTIDENRCTVVFISSKNDEMRCTGVLSN